MARENQKDFMLLVYLDDEVNPESEGRKMQYITCTVYILIIVNDKLDTDSMQYILWWYI